MHNHSLPPSSVSMNSSLFGRERGQVSLSTLARGLSVKALGYHKLTDYL